MKESFAPTILVDGETVTPPGCMWILGFAMAGCQWAIDEMNKPDVKTQIQEYLNRRLNEKP